MHGMSGRRIVVSIVDDEAAVRKALGRLLSASDLDAETFASGQAFLDSLPNRQPDCLVLDLHMPGLSGLEVLHRLSWSDSRVPTIIITAHDEPETRIQCLAAGASAYLRKPLDGQALLAAVTNAVEHAQASGHRESGFPGNCGQN
jgi:DNA-binding response OmpR family regulator